MFLGVPFNIASYSLLTHMVAQQCDYEVGEFVWTGGDIHLYRNHIEQAKKQLSRHPKERPQLKLNRAKNIFSYTFEDVCILNYDPLPHIKASVSI